MISKNDDLDDSSHEDDLDDFNDEKISTLSALVEKTKKLVEAEETKNEKWDRLDKTKVIYEEASAEIDQLSEKLDSPSLTSEEEIAIGDKLKTVELTSLEKEYEILKQCLEVVQSRLRERKSDAQNL